MFSILVVDDEPDNFDVIETLLSNNENTPLAHSSLQINYAASGAQALTSLELFQPDLILLDVMMPNMSGIEVCQRIKAMPQWKAVPIVMVTALTSKQDLALCLKNGADDFISKPVNSLELKARVQSMLRIRQQYKKLESFNALLEAKVKQRTVELETMILQDQLTMLPSRLFLVQKLTETLQIGKQSCTVVHLDCDQFKLVNGSFGYAFGNQLLIAIAQRLQQYLRSGDVLARMGEDEFCFLIHSIEDESILKRFIQKILQSFDTPFIIENREIFINVCIGVAQNISNQDNQFLQQPEELLQNADTAMYQAKSYGKGNYQIFDRQMHLTMLNRLTLESDLKRALEQQEFILHYQPIMNLQTQKIDGFEALVRWQHPEQGLVSPGIFIPCMEASGLILSLGIMVFKQACQQLAIWHSQGWNNLTMSINISGSQFTSPTLITNINRVLANTKVNPKYIKLEVTETVIMDNAKKAIALIEALKYQKIQISVDDFGTGYSSLAYLNSFPVDNLKIDRSFVSGIQSEGGKNSVVDTIVALGKQLGLSIIVEGIETEQQLDYLRKIGCDFGQGYLFSKPLVANEIESLFLK